MFEAYPEVALIDAQIADVGAEEQGYLKWMRDRRQEYREAVEAHHAAVDEAIREGKTPPERMPEPLPERDHADRVAAFEHRRRILHDQRQQVVASVAPKVEEKARKEVDAVLAEAREVAETLSGLTGRVAAAQGEVLECRAAQAAIDRADPQRGATRVEPMQQVTPESLLEAALRGGDLLAARPARRLGLTGGAFHGDVPDSAFVPLAREIQIRGR